MIRMVEVLDILPFYLFSFFFKNFKNLLAGMSWEPILWYKVDNKILKT